MIKNHAEYDYHIKYWKQIRTFVKGLDDVQNYLQEIVFGNTPEDARINKDFKESAIYYNFPSNTLKGLASPIFSKEAEVKLPATLKYLLLNANGAGKSLEQIAKVNVSNVLQIGRHGQLSDYSDITKLAKLTTYTAENIINWTEDESGNLNSVVLFIKKDVYKHLKLIDGIYTVEMRDEKDELIGDAVQPRKADGSKFTEIPFIIIGSLDNSPDVDEAPLYPIVHVTKGHYQNSAENELMLKKMQPTPWMNNIDKQYKDDMYPNGFIPFGTGAMLTLPKDGQAGLIQPSENQMITKAMKDKEDVLVMLGAKIIQIGSQAETAEATRIKASGETSVLLNIVGNVSRAIEQGLEWCAEFMGANSGEVVYVLNKQLFDMKMTPQDISAQILLLDRGLLAKQDVRRNLRNSDVVAQDRTDEDIDEEAEISGGGLV